MIIIPNGDTELRVVPALRINGHLCHNVTVLALRPGCHATCTHCGRTMVSHGFASYVKVTTNPLTGETESYVPQRLVCRNPECPLKTASRKGNQTHVLLREGSLPRVSIDAGTAQDAHDAREEILRAREAAGHARMSAGRLREAIDGSPVLRRLRARHGAMAMILFQQIALGKGMGPLLGAIGAINEHAQARRVASFIHASGITGQDITDAATPAAPQGAMPISESLVEICSRFVPSQPTLHRISLPHTALRLAHMQAGAGPPGQ